MFEVSKIILKKVLHTLESMLPTYAIGVLIFAIIFLILGVILKVAKVRGGNPLIVTGIFLLVVSLIWIATLSIHKPGYLGYYANIIGFIILVLGLGLSIIYFRRVRR